jgi:predicted glycosyltransferase
MKSVLVAVLDWGLGHATRSIPIIRELQHQNTRVIMAGNGPSLALLRQEFPDLKCYELPDYGIRYAEEINMLWTLARQLPRLRRAMKAEFKAVSLIVQTEGINAIISDNRYGCYKDGVLSVIVCHQLNLQLPKGWRWLTGLVNAWHEKYLLRFDQIWVPDMPDKSLSFSGDLSKTDLPNVNRIGILSRFGENVNSYSSKFDLVALVSGPEPQRTVFEDIMRMQVKNFDGNALLVKGLPESREYTFAGSLVEVNHLEASELDQILRETRLVVARAGYSTIMDLAVLGKKAILIPTPGQTEQEYLASFLASKNWVVARDQQNFDLGKAIQAIEKTHSIPHVKPNILLPKAITELLCRC